ncbi:MAG TPA: hypothetical protein VMQ10_06740 [Spirochaetia bacterium]|nr:hypothetical protein [Spirochaetia bacterium]
MTPDPVGGAGVRISVPGLSGLTAGETVLVHVIKQLDAGKWAVGVKGRVYPAFSDLPLESGAVLLARISGAPGKFILTLSARAEPDAVLTALASQGLPPGGLEEAIARALARSGLPIDLPTIRKLTSLLVRAEVDSRRGARAAATLVDKRIDPASSGAAALLKVLAFGHKGGEDPRRYRERPLPQTPRAVKEWAGSLAADGSAVAAAAGARASVLQAYNHRAGRSQAWVVIPFVFGSDGSRLEGTLKILYDAFKARPLALSISAGEVGLYLPLVGRRRILSIYCDSARVRRAAERGLDSLRSKFHNMGLEVDDTIKEGNTFDGFSPVAEGETLPSVDTVR